MEISSNLVAFSKHTNFTQVDKKMIIYLNTRNNIERNYFVVMKPNVLHNMYVA